MKMRVLGILSLALSLCLFNIADAQRGGQRGGGGAGGQRGGGGAGGQRGGGFGGQRGGGFGGQRGGGGPQGAMQLIGLIRMEEVRKEIDLDDDTYEAMTDAVRDVMPDFREMREMSEEERAEAGKKAETGMKDVMDEVLSPKQQDRLLGLLIQQAGYAAAANTLIAKKIDLDEDGIKKVSEAVAGSRTKLFEKMRASRGEGGGGERPDFSKLRLKPSPKLKSSSWMSSRARSSTSQSVSLVVEAALVDRVVLADAPDKVVDREVAADAVVDLVKAVTTTRTLSVRM